MGKKRLSLLRAKYTYLDLKNQSLHLYLFLERFRASRQHKFSFINHLTLPFYLLFAHSNLLDPSAKCQGVESQIMKPQHEIPPSWNKHLNCFTDSQAVSPIKSSCAGEEGNDLTRVRTSKGHEQRFQRTRSQHCL